MIVGLIMIFVLLLQDNNTYIHTSNKASIIKLYGNTIDKSIRQGKCL